MPQAMQQGVYWIGGDGKVYVKGDRGVNAAGVADANTDKYWGDRLYQKIADPNASAPKTTTVNNGGSGGAASGKNPVLNQAAIDNTQKAIGSLDTEQAVGLQSVDDSFNSLIGKYNNEATRAQGDYEENSVTNNQNLAKNKQNALVAAAQGRRGLRGVLSSFGALSGDGGRIADRVVTESANDDIGGAADTFATNQGTQDKAIKNFKEEDEDRRKEAEVQRNNQRSAVEGGVLSKRQQFLQKLAELYNEGGNTGEATRYLNQAGDLNTPIAQKGAVQATPFTQRSAAFTPGDLESYLAGAGDMTVSAEAGGAGGMNSPTILAGRKKREREMAV